MTDGSDLDAEQTENLRRQDDSLIVELQQRFVEHQNREASTMKKLQEDIEAIKVNTSELVELWSNAKGFIRVISVMGRVVKWVSAITLSLAAFYYAVTGRPFK